MSQLGTVVKTGETSGASGTATSTGTLFIIGEADSGPDAAKLVRSLADYAALYGPYSTASASLYNCVDTFFALNGGQAYVLRATNESATTAELSLTDSSSKPTIVVSAAYPGAFGNELKVEVISAKSGEAELRILNSENELLETSGIVTTQEKLLEWGEAHTAYVKIAKSEASEATTNLPKASTSKSLAGGANPTITEAEKIALLAGFHAELGPGQVTFADLTGEKAHVGLAEHGQTHNRDTWSDLADQSTTASLIAEKGTLSSGIAPYTAFTSSTVIVQGRVPGTTRTVPGSIVAAALCANVSATGNDNQAPIGVKWPLEPFVLGFTKEWTQVEMETLNSSQINSFARRSGVLCLFGFVTALSATLDNIFWQATAVRTRMRIAARAEEIGEEFYGSTLDGKLHDLAAFQAALQNLGKEEWEHDALYGASAAEACEVSVMEPVNTKASMQEGKLKAQMKVLISPYAQAVTIDVTVGPITEAA